MGRDMRTKEEYFFNINYKVMSCILIGMIAGSIYAIYLKNQYALYYSIEQLVSNKDQIQSLEVIKNSFLTYFLQLSVIFISIQYNWGQGVAYSLLTLTTFTHGFSVASIILLYGIKGVLIAILLFGTSSIALISLEIYTITKKKKINKEIQRKKKEYWIMLSVICAGISVFNAYIQPLIEEVVYHIL